MILLDVFEPKELERLLSQSAQVSRIALNSMGYADVMFTAHDGHRIQIENKQAEELLGAGLNGVEEQLRRQVNNAEESMLLIRGIIVPAVDGCQVYRQSTSGSIFHKSRKYKKTNYSGYRAWCWRLDKAGVTVIEVPDINAAAVTIGAIYGNSQKADHATFQRYIKPKPYVEDYDPFVLTLMGIVMPAPGIGEKKAKELLEVYGTPWAVYCRSEDELSDVIGRALARKLLEAIGK